MFRPPVNRAMKALDRSYFQKRVPLAAARVLQSKQISKCRVILEDDLLKLERTSVVKNDLEDPTMKAILLKPEIKPDSMFDCSPIS